MIIRQAINARYTHDREALVALFMDMPEFFGVTAEQWDERLKPLEQFSYSRDYYWCAEREYAWAVHTSMFRPNLPKVSFWHVHDTARRILEDHGFSCIVCRAHTDWEALGKIHEWDIVSALTYRQGCVAPTLVCDLCAIQVPTLLTRFVGGQPQDAMFERFVERITA